MRVPVELPTAVDRLRPAVRGTAINYIDRQMIGVLKSTPQADLRWTELQYADIVFWFQPAYAFGFLIMGPVVDAVSARTGYAFTFWAMAHGLVRSVAEFAAVRFALGLREAGNFPSGLKAVANWFPKRERALAVGLLNAGADVGAIVTPLLVPLITLTYGWRVAFMRSPH